MGLPNQKCVWEQCKAGNVVRAVSRQELLREAGLGDCEGMSRSPDRGRTGHQYNVGGGFGDPHPGSY